MLKLLDKIKWNSKYFEEIDKLEIVCNYNIYLYIKIWKSAVLRIIEIYYVKINNRNSISISDNYS